MRATNAVSTMIVAAFVWALPPAAASDFHPGLVLVASRQSNGLLELRTYHGEKYPGLRIGTFGTDPWDLAFGPDGLLWVSLRSQNRVGAYDAGFQKVGEIGFGSNLSGPEGIAFGPGGHLFVASTFNDRVIEFDLQGTVVKEYLYTPWSAEIDGPSGVALAADGRLLVAAYHTNRVVEFDLDGYGAATFADTMLNPEFVTPLPGGDLLVGSSGTNSWKWFLPHLVEYPAGEQKPAGLNYPMRAVLTPEHHLLFASYGNDTLLLPALGVSVTNGYLGGSFLDGPVGVAFSPYRFSAKIKGNMRTAVNGDIKVNEKAVLHVIPGSTTAFLRLADGLGPDSLAARFQSRDIVFQGYDFRDGKKALWQGTQEPRGFGDLPVANIGLRLKSKFKKGQFVKLKNAKGTLHLTFRSVLFAGQVKTVKLLD